MSLVEKGRCELGGVRKREDAVGIYCKREEQVKRKVNKIKENKRKEVWVAGVPVVKYLTV